jgi:hypothetical protein
METWERLQADDKKEELKEAKFQRLYSYAMPPTALWHFQ